MGGDEGTTIVASAADITDVAVGPDGAIAFWASDGRKQFVGVGGERQPSVDKAYAPRFLTDGTLVHTATDRGAHFAMIGASKTPLPHPAEGVAVSADGKRVTPWYRQDRGGRHRIVINGAAGQEFDRVSRPTIHADTGAFAYTAQNSDGFFVVTTRGRSERYDGVLWNPRINDDGTMVAYAALQGRELWWKVARLP